MNKIIIHKKADDILSLLNTEDFKHDFIDVNKICARFMPVYSAINNTSWEYETKEIKAIFWKLFSDGYIQSPIDGLLDKNQFMLMYDKLVFSITFDGITFIEKGGYTDIINENKENTQRNKNTYLLGIAAAIFAGMQAISIVFQSIQFFEEHEYSEYKLFWFTLGLALGLILTLIAKILIAIIKKRKRTP